MMRYILVIISLFPFACLAQEDLATLNQFSGLIYNPGASAIDTRSSFSFLNRRVQIAPGISYRSMLLQAEHPFTTRKSEKPFGGFGFHFLQKDAGEDDMIKSLDIGVSLAYNLHIGKSQQIIFGMQGRYSNQKNNFHHLSTGSQWIASEFRFDPAADIGESFVENTIDYLGINAGLTWYLSGPKNDDQQRAFVTINAFNLNTPDDSFLSGQSYIPTTYQIRAGALILAKEKFQISPQLFYDYNNMNNLYACLISWRTLFENKNPYDILRSGSLEVLTKINSHQALALGLAFHQPSISLAFSYEFQTANKNNTEYAPNTVELGVSLSKAIGRPRHKQDKTSTSSTVGVKRTFDFQGHQRADSTNVLLRSDENSIRENIQTLTKVKSVQFQLEKNFHFDFGKTTLDAEAKNYLDDLYEVLFNNPEYKLEVIGHTDNVGKPNTNYRLSAARAKAVADYLVSIGLEPERIKHSGRGDTEPKAPNTSEDSRMKNRRVEFLIYVDR